VLSLLRLMANTPYASWAGCEHFGLRELLEQGLRRPEKVRVAVEEMNRALDDLGITNFLVDSIRKESPVGADLNHWVVTLASKADRSKTYSFEWRGSTQ